MNHLSPMQCRVIGVLLEKEITTPDQYPLSLNSLTNACNQKSNREPVLSLTESEVQQVVDELMSQNLISDQGAFSGRVAKYQHRFCNTEFGDLQLTAQQRAIICLLFLRGPQTPGELRTRSNRLADFANVDAVEAALTQLHDLNEQQYVVKLAREPGKRESRYAHLFSGEVSQADVTHENTVTAAVTGQGLTDEALLQRVEMLEMQVAKLTEQMNELLS
ncbi:YceH family protein [Thalassotalea sp. PLHSN55]|uniref:YceH family protein n=1 Tax=Thalassotalea sp. PLHSN55 TaxID=3435888 RepID=UPI003F84C706